MKVTFALFIATTEAIRAAHGADIKPLIVGGVQVPPDTKTYSVGLRSTATSTTFCGGSLITPTHVLTAAHCAASSPHYVAIGTHLISGSQDGEVIPIKKQTRHPSYRAQFISFDFNIIELATPSTFPPVKLLDQDSDKLAGAMATTLGWGATSSGGSQSRYMLRADVPVLSTAECRAAKLRYNIDLSMMCAGGNRKDSCQGDSGGPLVVERVTGDALIGVVSWGDGCAAIGKPGVYAKPKAVKAWINAMAPGAVWTQ